MSALPSEAVPLSPLEQALELAGFGFHLFPLAKDSKKPAHKGWQDEATCDRRKITAWAEGKPWQNFGIHTGRYGHDGARALLVVDVDSPDHGNGTKNGPRRLLELELEGKDFPPTMTGITGSGGRHLVYVADEAVRQGVDVLGDGLDIRSAGGLIVAPGSVVQGKRYALATAGPFASPRDYVAAPAPAWLVDACGKPRPKAANREPLPGIDPERAQARAVEYLTKHAPEAIEGAGGDHTTFVVAAKLKDLGVDEATAARLMLELWHDGCGWRPDELAVKVRNAFAYGANPPGADAPEAQFAPVEPEPEKASAPHPFDELNAEWAAVAEPPNTVVYRTRIDAGTGQKVFERWSREGFMGLLANRRFDGAPLALKWWESARRRTFEGGTAFAPGAKVPANVLNTWGGLAVAPARGDWSLMREHIRGVICGGDAALDAYVIRWLARVVQRPGEPGQVALVLRGGRGTGKGTLGEMFGRLFGRHAMHIGNAQRLVGNFNGHLEDKVFLFADEAFYAGDRKHEGVLKALITERALDVEAKYVAARNVRNCLHILMASNDDWVVPAGAQERRFCVIDVADSRQQDIDYFGQVRQQMEAGGLAAMLHDLLQVDLSDFNVWAVPHTQAGTDQRASSLRGVDRWLFDALAQRRIADEEWSDAGVQVSKDTAYHDYKSKARDLGDYTPATVVGFWKRIAKVLEAGGIQPKDVQVRIGTERERRRVLPPIDEARQAFDQWLGGSPLEWDG